VLDFFRSGLALNLLDLDLQFRLDPGVKGKAVSGSDFQMWSLSDRGLTGPAGIQSRWQGLRPLRLPLRFPMGTDGQVSIDRSWCILTEYQFAPEE
jgi:hypothetical protein